MLGKIISSWNSLVLDGIAAAERGPTISSRYAASVNAGIQAALSEQSAQSLRALIDVDALTHRESNLINAYLASSVARAMVRHVGLPLFDDQYLENSFDLKEGTGLNTGKDAVFGDDQSARALRRQVSRQANQLFDRSRQKLAFLSEEDIQLIDGISSDAISAIRKKYSQDGSNMSRDYEDTSGYYPEPWVVLSGIGPLQARPLGNQGQPIGNSDIDINFFQDEWVFSEYDPHLAYKSLSGSQLILSDEGTLTSQGLIEEYRVNPAVSSGQIKLTQSWQPLGFMGIFPTIEDGGTQVPLTPHWGSVDAYSFTPQSMGLELGEFSRPYQDDGDLNDEFIRQADDVAQLSKRLKAGSKNVAADRAIAEFWELGDGTVYPPGYWIQSTLATAKNLGIKGYQLSDLLSDVSQAVSDSAIKAWGYKYEYDSVRPITAINQLFWGSLVPDWSGDEVAQVDDRSGWNPYQLRRNWTPPFPDIPSGHSAFSSSAAVIQRHYFGSNYMPSESESFVSRFDASNGFDGVPGNGNEQASLDWKYISQQAEEAGFSRMLGGIHMEDGNILGQSLGTRIGHRVLLASEFYEQNQTFFGLSQNKSGNESLDVYIDKNMPSLMFGSLSDDDFRGRDLDIDENTSLLEVYGFGGDDIIGLSFDRVGVGDGVELEVRLFGGDGDDVFAIDLTNKSQSWRVMDLGYQVGASGVDVFEDIVVYGDFIDEEFAQNANINLLPQVGLSGDVDRTIVMADTLQLFSVDGDFVGSNLGDKIIFQASF